tara:strand:+ start:390 stop:1382 length:993 start_codon:yes stop_codon:yes gene_type:complete
MRNVLFFCVLLFGSNCFSQVTLQELSRTKGIYYLNNKPYTGAVKDVYQDLDSTGMLMIELIDYEGNMVEGKKDGKWSYYQGADLDRTQNYSKGKKDGECVWYNYNEIKSWLGNYRNDKKDGEWKSYNYDGHLTRTDIYDNGKWQDYSLTEAHSFKRFKAGFEGGLIGEAIGLNFCFNVSRKHGLYSSFSYIMRDYNGPRFKTFHLDTGVYSMSNPQNTLTGNTYSATIDKNGYSAQLGYFYQFLSRGTDLALSAQIAFGVSYVDRTTYLYEEISSTQMDTYLIHYDTKVDNDILVPSFCVGFILERRLFYYLLAYNYMPTSIKWGFGFRF